MRQPRPRNGYVLLMTVVLIAVAGLFMAGIARQSLLLVGEARESQEVLQQRWGTFSCQETILKNADRVLRLQDVRGQQDKKEATAACASVSAKLRLGDMEFDLVLADETTKISLNSIYRSQGEEGVQRIIQESAQLENGPPRLRPYRVDGDSADYPAFDSWGQVFALEHAGNDTLAAKAIIDSTKKLTCWGEGKLNAERADDKTVEFIARFAVDDNAIGHLLELRREHFEQAKTEPQEEARANSKRWFPELLDALALRRGERRKLESLLTDRSTCYSLWTTASSKQRSWQRLCILDLSVESRPKCWSYCW